MRVLCLIDATTPQPKTKTSIPDVIVFPRQVQAIRVHPLMVPMMDRRQFTVPQYIRFVAAIIVTSLNTHQIVKLQKLTIFK